VGRSISKELSGNLTARAHLTKDLRDTIDLNRRDFSLILVEPRPIFLEWLGEFAKREGWEGYRLFVPEDDTVLVIPSIDRFSEPGSLEEFVNALKPNLLRLELIRFHVKGIELGTITNETFDKFFAVSVRDRVHFMSDLTLK
jgi:hypothetical protein